MTTNTYLSYQEQQIITEYNNYIENELITSLKSSLKKSLVSKEDLKNHLNNLSKMLLVTLVNNGTTFIDFNNIYVNNNNIDEIWSKINS